MKTRRQKATKAEQERYEALKAMGCIISRIWFQKWSYPEIQHLTSGGRRISNLHTIPLNSWYHRGIIPADCKTTSEATKKYGPSFAKSRKEFEAIFGSEENLLEKTNEILHGGSMEVHI